MLERLFSTITTLILVIIFKEIIITILSSPCRILLLSKWQGLSRGWSLKYASAICTLAVIVRFTLLVNSDSVLISLDDPSLINQNMTREEDTPAPKIHKTRHSKSLSTTASRRNENLASCSLPRHVVFPTLITVLFSFPPKCLCPFCNRRWTSSLTRIKFTNCYKDKKYRYEDNKQNRNI